MFDFFDMDFTASNDDSTALDNTCENVDSIAFYQDSYIDDFWAGLNSDEYSEALSCDYCNDEIVDCENDEFDYLLDELKADNIINELNHTVDDSYFNELLIDKFNSFTEIYSIFFYQDCSTERCYWQNLEQFDPYKYSDCIVHGNPEIAMAEWEYQDSTNRCALYSQKFIIEELTDFEIDIDELVELAEKNGWFSEEYGTSIENLNSVLDYYGIQNSVTFGNDIDDISNCLDAGQKVLVVIDSDEIWYGEQDYLYTPGDSVNHAVEVIGIVENSIGETMVVLNDSGSPNGCGEMIPADVFTNAWNDGNCMMITATC